MKVWLVNPPDSGLVTGELPPGVAGEVGRFPPLGLMILSSFLKKNIRSCDVKIIDMASSQMDIGDFIRRAAGELPDLVGITGTTHNLVAIAKLAAELREKAPSITVCLGGPHVDAFPEEALNLTGVDFTVRGEGERPLEALVRFLQDEGKKTRPPEDIPGLSWKTKSEIHFSQEAWYEPNPGELPFPDRDGVNLRAYSYVLAHGRFFTTAIASRGCPHRCTFCATPGGGYRMTPAARVADELALCAGAGVDEVHFVDDTFCLRPARLTELAEEILGRGLKMKWSMRTRADALDKASLEAAADAGCVRIHLGVETSSDEGMRVLGKGITVSQVRDAVKWAHGYGIDVAAYFMLGCPFEKSVADLRRTVDFAVSLEPEYAMFNILALYPGTKLFDDAVARGLVDQEYWAGFAADPRRNFVVPFWEEYLDRNTLYRETVRAYRKFYLRPGPVLRELRKLGANPGDVVRKLAAAAGLFRSI